MSREDKVLFLELILSTVRRTKEQKIAMTVRVEQIINKMVALVQRFCKAVIQSTFVFFNLEKIH